MSVLIPELKVFEAIHGKIEGYKFHKVCDINYCSSLKLEENEAKEFIKNILTLNELSYIKRYREDTAPHLKDFLTFKYKGETISTLQLLKYLECIYYNIEIYTIKNGYEGNEQNEIKPDLMRSYEVLKKSISELKSTVISELTNYRELKYCEA